jgi:hypothetical protein
MRDVLKLATDLALSEKLGSKPQGMDRRRFVIGAAATALAIAPAFAQEAFPSRAITIVNAFPPGGLNDIVTRPLATAMEPTLKQPVVIETKAGAAGQVGAQVVASAKPDGYTLLSHNTGISGYAEVDKLFGRPAKVTRAHFIALARVVADPVLLLVNETQPYNTLQEFIAGTKASLTHSSSLQAGCMVRRICRWPILRRRPARCTCDICRPAAADRPSLPCWVTMPRSPRYQWEPRYRTSKQGSCARSPFSARAAQRSCPMCRRSRSLDLTSNIILGLAYSHRAARRAKSQRRCGPLSGRRSNQPNFIPHSPMPVRNWHILMGRSSRNSGTLMASEPTRR